MYRKRIRTNAVNPTWFRASQIEKEFQNTRIKNFYLALQGLKHLELLKVYTDGGFAITSKEINRILNELSIKERTKLPMIYDFEEIIRKT